MSFKSEAQRRKFHEMFKQGKISKETLDKWEAGTTASRLPDRVPQQHKIKNIKTIK